MKFGYARVSTFEQNLHLQIDALKAYGVDELYEEKISGANWQRPRLDEMMLKLRAGDQVVVWRLDRFGRTTQDLLNLVKKVEEKGAEFISLHEKIDTTTSGGKLIFTVFAAVAEFERNTLIEKTNAGIAAAKRRGRKFGPPYKLLSDQVNLIRELMNNPERDIKAICHSFRISRATLYRYMNR